MGHSIDELRLLRSRSVGTEVGKRDDSNNEDIAELVDQLNLRPKLGLRDKAILARYISDVQSAVCEVSRVLAPGGKAIYVVGENTIRGTFIRNSTIVVHLAKLAGLHLRKRSVRHLPANRRYLPPPRKKACPSR